MKLFLLSLSLSYIIAVGAGFFGSYIFFPREVVIEKKVEVTNTQYETTKFCQQMSAITQNDGWSYESCVESLSGVSENTSARLIDA